MKIKDERGKMTPDESVAIPTDLIDKYAHLFKGKQWFAVLDLIRQAYKAGLDIGRHEAQPCRK
jgi:hypothetical protein